MRFRYFAAVLGLAALTFATPARCAESLKVTSTPPGALVEIDGVVVGTTPFHADYPGCYFHKPHAAFSARLEHAIVLRVSKGGYALQQIILTEGPLDWIGLTGKKHGKYFVLRSDHFELNLEPVRANEPGVKNLGISAGSDLVGPIHPRGADAFVDANAGSAKNTSSSNSALGYGDSGTVVIVSEPASAEIYVDGKFVGQTPATIPLLAGAHSVLLKANGRKDWKRELTVLRESQVALRAILESP